MTRLPNVGPDPGSAAEPPVRESVIRRGEPIPVQNPENGYFQCWYPLALSAEVAPGQVVGREFMNGRVIVYRGQNGQAVVQSAFCRHLGSDLALGTVIGNEIRCIYHHWSYDQSGVCVRTAAGDPPPPKARLFRFPTAEKWGLIWAFNGTEPLYELPDPGVAEDTLVVRTIEKEVLPVEPYVPFSNALDLQHLQVIHQMQCTRLPEKLEARGLMIEYDVEFVAPLLGKAQQHIRMYGSNSIILRQEFMNRTVYMMSFGRILPGRRTCIYNVVATPRSSGKPGEDQMVVQILNAAEAFGDRLQEEDRPVMHTMSFRQDCLSGADKFMGEYLRFTQAFPRSSVACDLIAP